MSSKKQMASQTFSPYGPSNPILYRHYHGMAPSEISRELRLDESVVIDVIVESWRQDPDDE